MEGFDFENLTQLLNDFNADAEIDASATMNVGLHLSASAEIFAGPVYSDSIRNLTSSIALGSNFPADNGERAVNWTLAMNNFASRPTYSAWWHKFLSFCSYELY
jgi:hypothetical protein